MKASPQVFDESHALKCELAAEVLRSAGKLKLQVTGWSMLPSVLPGDTLVVEPVKRNAIAAGDIVMFGRDRRLFAHRVVKGTGSVGESVILTRGDSMPRPDAPVHTSDLLGRVSGIVRNGKHIRPRRNLRFAERTVAALVRRSEIAARVVVGAHGMRQAARNSN